MSAKIQSYPPPKSLEGTKDGRVLARALVKAKDLNPGCGARAVLSDTLCSEPRPPF